MELNVQLTVAYRYRRIYASGGCPAGYGFRFASLRFRQKGVAMAPQIPSQHVTATEQKPIFDPRAFLAKAGSGRTVSEYAKKQLVFSQGDVAADVFYIQKGKVKLTVISEHGKEAVVAILGPGEFCGEGCLTGQPKRLPTATAMTECEIMRVEKAAFVRVLHEEPAFSEIFVSYLLTRTIRVEADLVDQLFNSSEKRLARTLLQLANFGNAGVPEPVIAKISQEMLAEMIGTTRSRVSFFMNKFRKLGFISYDTGHMEIHGSLLSVVLNERPPHIKSITEPSIGLPRPLSHAPISLLNRNGHSPVLPPRGIAFGRLVSK
jgi:CRP/FNR family cyclic AMP-dependent transcriptional regulator